MTATDPITAIIDQLAACAEQLTRLDTRHADHQAAMSARLTELTGQTAALGHTLQEHAAALTSLAAISQPDPDPDGYCPGPAPAWWKLAGADRSEPIARLPRAWKNPAYRRARRLGLAPQDAIAELPVPGEEPEPGLPDYVPAEWLRSDGTDFPWS